MIINNYKFEYDDVYIIGFCAVAKGNDYDFTGQMSQHMDVVDSIQYGGYYKFIKGEFVLDEVRKEEMLKKWEEEHNVSQ